MTISTILWCALASGGLGVLYVLATVFWLARQSIGNDTTQSIAKSIKRNAKAFLKLEYSAVALLAIPAALALTYFGQWTANGFIVGAVGSVLASYIGVAVAVDSNVRTVVAAKNRGLTAALSVAVKGGSVVGVALASLALLNVTGYYALAQSAIPSDQVFRALIGLGLGSTLASLFTRIANGIFAKAATVNMSQIDTDEVNITEEDPRNPAIIVGNVGVNISDSAGLAADLYETYTLTLVAAILLAKTAFGPDSQWIEFPLLISAIAIAATILAGLLVRLGKRKRIVGALYRSLLISVVLAGGALYYASIWFLALPGIEPAFDNISLPAVISVGLVLVGFIVLSTEYYTSAGFRPVKRIASDSVAGHASNLIAGLAVGKKATILPLIVAFGGLTGAYFLGGGFTGNPWGGLFAVALAVVATVSLAGILTTFSTYGAIVGNSFNIAEMAELYEIKHSIAIPLVNAGDTVKAVVRGYAAVSAGLAALVLFAGYSKSLTTPTVFDLSNPSVLFGLFIGGLLSYWVAARLLRAVNYGTSRVTEEVSRQFREIPGILEGGEQPKYGLAVDIATRSAIRQTFVPVLIVLAVPVAVGLLVGKDALGGLLIGIIVTGLLQSLAYASSGSAWHSARKHIENGSFGGNRSAAHQASVTGDTLGGAYKDAVAPALNSLVKAANIVALLIAPLIA